MLDWKGDRKNFDKISDVQILFALSTDDVIKNFLGKEIMDHLTESKADATTILFENNGKFEIKTILFVDKLSEKPDGTPRTDIHSHLPTVLAHEIYGNINNHINKIQNDTVYQSIDENHSDRKYTDARINDEIIAFQAGIDFIDRVLVSGAFDSAPDLKSEFINKKNEEMQMLNGWKNGKK